MVVFDAFVYVKMAPICFRHSVLSLHVDEERFSEALHYWWASYVMQDLGLTLYANQVERPREIDKNDAHGYVLFPAIFL